MSIIAIITARGGSKRIPKKNIKEFMGKPMIAYAIQAAKNAKIFDEIMVSTDDEEIAQVAIKYGAKVPFMRSSKNADDFAGTEDVLLEVIHEYQKSGIFFDKICCIYPCVPFLTASTLKRAYNHFIMHQEAESLMPAVKYSFPIQRAVYLNVDGFIVYREPENAEKRSQDLDLTYHDVGMFYFIHTAALLQYKNLITPKTILFEMDEMNVQDIDALDDWKTAELKYKIINMQKEK